MADDHEARMAHHRERAEALLARQTEVHRTMLERSERALDLLAVRQGGGEILEEDLLFVGQVAAEAKRYAALGPLAAALRLPDVDRLQQEQLPPDEYEHIAIGLEALAAGCRACAAMGRVLSRALEDGLEDLE